MEIATLTATEMEELEELRRTAPLLLIAARIKRARKSAGLSHDKLSEATGGIHRPNLIAYEKAKHRPTVETIIRLAAATNREPRWFLDEEIDPSPFQDEQEAA